MSYERVNYDPTFKPVQGIYENRLRQFINNGGDYKDLNLPKFYDYKRISLDRNHVKVYWYQVPFEKNSSPVSPDKRPPWSEVIGNDKAGKIYWQEASINQPFGPSWSTTWFKVELHIPKDWMLNENDQLVFDWDCSNEGVVIDPNTLNPKTAFSGGDRTEYLLPKADDGKYFFYVETGNNGMFGCGEGSDINPPNDNRYFHLKKADIVLPDWEARALYIDFWMVSDAARELPGDSWQKHQARTICNKVMDIFDPKDRSSVKRCRNLLKNEYFDKYVDSADVYRHGNEDILTDVYGMGNCHIDTAWLWPFAETRRKIVRSWSSQCTLMEEYPEYQFVASQAQQFKWLLEDHPRFFKECLIPKFQQNQFFPIGGSWVENDTNMPGSEALARQFFFGQRFFLKHFGSKSTVFWLPDTFGYSSQVPQLCQLSGIDKFLTQKLSWNNINSFPHSTFNWAGLDGTQLLTHMPPGNTYTADSHFGDVLRTAKQNKTSEYYGSGLMLYGKGDGGGGPTREMLEKMRRIRSMSNRNGNVVPKLEVGKTIEEFYDDILARTDNGKDLPTWSGELYFEFHRGTYTSQANTKRLMRFSEIKIHDLEWIATKTSMLFPDQYIYPAKEINDLWENILLCQFHDVLPGSCIEIVYKHEALPMLQAVIEKCADLIIEALKVLKNNSKSQNIKPIKTLVWSDSDSAFVSSVEESAVKVTEASEYITLSNEKLKVMISKQSGSITSIIDLDTEVEYLDLKNGRNKHGANQFVIFDDKPLSWQAWDTELYSVNQYTYLNKAETVVISENSKDKASVKVIIPVEEGCKIITTISLSATLNSNKDDSFIDIHTHVDNWNARNKFLKVEFPVKVRSDFASYETQFGITRRPTHYNTSWDVAKFEVCSHKFADYSEYNKGVSIFNDSKFGFSTHGNLMRLSILRSPKAPDAHADMGSHDIRYAIYPHAGALSSTTVRLAHEFNYIHRYEVPATIYDSFDQVIKITGDSNVVLSNIKRGEDDVDINSNYAIGQHEKRSMIVRVYESLGGDSSVVLKTSLPIKKVVKVDNLENEIEVVTFTSNSKTSTAEIPINLNAFEVASYKLCV
ncbi:hypothetical protein TPHA_0G00880 [Tetrapisispora phaffii CBS 4417]|uniref:Alpha-mannosidase n=1 Tax=Tetrapisispora phaffii (strain ATCC 24235 / CBS 4417 / NBRC 1672 / NRRL Y-8282 / UCD 70-5) TaxID=1071381 RepID=G8BVJ6_TETPH|nr:hypothetical protein TPHA_0G00880 [Tetrapisispora phaffii CBS 4417]CCE63924.1 hypothetical protein TPHA_0G00880 [Tetrapisispora phaffii CBS 4417]